MPTCRSSEAAAEQPRVRVKVKIKKDDTVKVIAGRDGARPDGFWTSMRSRAECWWKA